ncbi:hypothetical protein I316_05660 [Kwoniella heveanensis BCC8398]|uniref:GH18 domain-containing protein n=1 Tax=Kwoniella heveanensis BCC8398 TaxID=1296120 RepID=A0A1B9GNR0_9TREE|nr:hypothetical protein I316_05660 [Kwoniella heveanensis BCC8398]
MNLSSVCGLLTILSLSSQFVSAAHLPSDGDSHTIRSSSHVHGNGGSVGTADVHSWAGYRSVGYFTSWGIYDPQNFFVTNITAKDFTHINYAFANVSAEDGTVFLSDPEADTNFEYPSDNVDEQSHNLYGNLNQLFLLKKQNRNLKMMLSIGGYTFSPAFQGVINAKWRETFTNTSVALLRQYGFDGLDVDYGHGAALRSRLAFVEFIRGAEAQGIIELFRLLRAALDEAATLDGAKHYLLTWAAACGFYGWQDNDVAGMDKYLDFWNLMAYDFSGSWTNMTLPASNLYPDTNPINDVGASGSQCVEHYIKEGVNPRKLNLGMPLYGTGFNQSQGMWSKWEDIGGGDYDQPGNYDIKHLPLEGSVMFYNKSIGASWSYDNVTGHVVSFDTPTVALQKAKYVMDNKLGGMMYWSIDQDYTKLQASEKPTEHHWPGQWNPSRGGSKKGNYGHFKGAPWPLPESVKITNQNNWLARRSSSFASASGESRGVVAKRGWRDWASVGWWGQMDDWRNGWTLKVDDGICTNIGYSLVDIVVTAFEKYGGGLDRTRNQLDYPGSEYDNIRNAQ